MTKAAFSLALASGSPRRKDLLAEAGYRFDIIPSDADETFDPTLSPKKNAALVAERKAEVVATAHPDRPILAADTIVVLDGEVIGKPVDERDARNMLARLSGATHTVYTGLALIHKQKGTRFVHVEGSEVRFHPVPEEAIAAYVATGEPMDKAGAYAIQGGAAAWIAGFDGSRSNIIGLPMEVVTDALRRFGVHPEGETPCA